MVAYLTSSADFIWVLGQPYYLRNNLCVLCYLDLAWQVSQVGQSLSSSSIQGENKEEW